MSYTRQTYPDIEDYMAIEYPQEEWSQSINGICINDIVKTIRQCIKLPENTTCVIRGVYDRHDKKLFRVREVLSNNKYSSKITWIKSSNVIPITQAGWDL